MSTTELKPVIIVTGASKGLGLAITKILLQKFNAIVVGLCRSRTPELEVLSSPTLLVIRCDIADETEVSQAISVAEKTYSRIDGVILNAGTIEPLGRIGSTDIQLDAWKALFEVNVFSLVSTLKAALPALRRSKTGGRVVFVSSGAAVKGIAGWGAYNASKAAMNSICRTLAEEEPDIISVAVRPGVVDTGMQELLRSTGAAHMSEADHVNFLKLHAEGKLVKPEESGQAIAALALRAPKSLSGQFISWDGDECAEYRN